MALCLVVCTGLIKAAEVQSGLITHAFRFTGPSSRNAYEPPATHYAGEQVAHVFWLLGMDSFWLWVPLCPFPFAHLPCYSCGADDESRALMTRGIAIRSCRPSFKNYHRERTSALHSVGCACAHAFGRTCAAEAKALLSPGHFCATPPPPYFLAAGKKGANYPWMGMRARLKKSFNCSSLSGPAQVVCTALKKYGEPFSRICPGRLPTGLTGQHVRLCTWRAFLRAFVIFCVFLGGSGA